MDILRLLVKSPFILIRLTLTILLLICRLCAFILRPILGHLDWQAPRWYEPVKAKFNALENKVAQYAVHILLFVLVIIALVFTIKYIQVYQANKPQPIPAAEIITKKVSFALRTPSYPDLQDPNNKQILRLTFSDSTAPIEKIEKSVNTGISLTPVIKGSWLWDNDSQLTFTAEEPFILGQSYKVQIKQDELFAPNVVLSASSKPTVEFTAPNFYADIIDATLSNSPESPQERHAFFTIRFPVPVDKKSFESAIELNKKTLSTVSQENRSKTLSATDYLKIPFTVKYDAENENIAYIQSDALMLEEYPSQLKLLINQSIKGKMHSLTAPYDVSKTLDVPDQFGLHVESIESAIVEQKNQEQQVLMIHFNDLIDPSIVQTSLKVWLLPERLDNQGWTSQNIKDSDLIEQVSLKSIITDDQFDDESNNTKGMVSSVQFLFNAPENRTLYVTIDKQDIVSNTGYKLKESVNTLVSVNPFTAKVNFTSDGAILPLKGSKVLDISARNLNGTQVELFRIRPNQLQHLVWQKDYDYASWYDHNGTASHFSDYFTKFIRFDPNKKGKTQHQSIDLSPFLSDEKQFPRGIFLIKLRSWSGESNKIQPPLADTFNDQDWIDWEWYENSNQIDGAISKGDVFDQRIIVVTDIGIITKRDIDQSWHVFAQSISQNSPIANAKVSVIAQNGSELLNAISDENGHVHFPSLAHFTGEQKPSYFLVQNPTEEDSTDFSFLPVFYGHDRMIDFSRFDIGGNQQSRDPKSLSSYLFSDRGIYRPGDTFNVGIITRTADWSNQLEGIPLLAVIYDARYQEVKRQTIILDNSGFNELSFSTAENSPTGEWRVELYLPGKNSQQSSSTSNEPQVDSLNDALLLGDVTLNIKEFEPDRLKVKLSLTPKVANEGWVNPADVKANVNVNTLFDTPAQNRRVSAQLTLKPVYPHFKRFDDYQFYENKPNRDGISEQLEDVITDDKGQAEIKMTLSSFEEGSYQLNLLVEAFELGAGRSVAGTANMLISPYDYLIGFKQSDDLSFINQDALRHINLIAIDPNLKKTSVSDLVIDLTERKYISVLAQQPSGAYQYQSKLKETVIKSIPLTISSEGNDLKLETQNPGDYVLVIKNKENQVLNRIYYSVAGNADISKDLDRAAELNVKLDKTIYKPGEKMAISINAPYTGSGLITIERDKVYSWHWFNTDTTNSVQEITLPEMANFEGNAYVTVQFVRDSNSPEIFMSPLSYAAVPFKLSHEARTAKLSISAPALLKSGETLSMTVKTDSPQNVILFAVDEGILQVARYKLKDPLDYFFQKRALEVRSAQILDLILPEYTQLQQFIAAAGGDASDGLDLHLNPFKRKKDQPVVFWSGIQSVEGEKTFDFPLPSYFSGKIRIMAVSVTPEKIGHIQTESVIRDDIVLSPNAPTTVAPNDEFEVSVGVTNNLEASKTEAQDLRIYLKTTPELTIVSSAEQMIRLAPNSEGVVTFRLRANQLLGGADLHLNVDYLDNQQKTATQSRQVGISIRPLVPHRAEIQMGRMDGKQQKVSDLRTLYPNFAINEARVSYSPLLLSGGLSTFLSDYQHQCSEQIISRAIPLTVQQNFKEFTENKDLDKISDEIDDVIALLLNRQNSRGAIGLWQVEQNPDPFITAHAVMFMLEAQAANLHIPETLLNKANHYLRGLSNDLDLYQLEDLRLRAYAAYLLAKQGEVVTTQIADIESRLIKINDEQSTDLTALYLAATYQLLKLDNKAKQWLQPTLKELTKAYDKSWWNNNYWDPLVMDATRLTIIGEHFPEEFNKLPPQVLDNFQSMIRDQRFTTLSSAMSILALDRYSKATNQVTLQTDNHSSLSILSQFIDMNKQTQLAEISSTSGMLVSGQFQSTNENEFPTQSILFKNLTDLPAWYSVTQSGFDYSHDNQPRSDGLEISRYYTDLENNPITQVKLGDTINVHLKVRANSNEGQTSIAIVDLLPGGFEVVQQVLLEQSNDEQSEESEETDNTPFISPLSINGSWYPNYTDVREDRVLIYGYAEDIVQDFVYQIKATNIGTYQVPPSYAEAMYNRRVQAISKVENDMLNVIQP